MPKWLETVGISGVIAAAGYIGESGRESLLGIELHDFNFSRYATACGYFVLSTVDIVARALAAHWLKASLGLVVLSLLLLLVSRITRRPIATASLVACAATVLGFGTYVLINDGLPLFLVKNMLVQNPEVELGLGNPRAKEVWRRILCVHDAGKKLNQCADTDRASAALEAEYVNSVLHFAVLVALIVGFRIIVKRAARRLHLGRGWFTFARILAPMMTCVLTIDGLMLPYIHSKLMVRTEFVNLDVTYTTTANTIASSFGYLLHRSDDAITFYEAISARQYGITEIPLSRIVRLQSGNPKDVLSYHIEKTAPGKADERQAPPTQ